MFQNNQQQIYRELNQKGERCDDDGRYNRAKFEKDSWQNAKLRVTRSRLSPGALDEEF